MKYVVLVVSLVLLAYLVMDFNSRTAELNRLRAEQEAISTRLESRESTKSALAVEIAYATSEAAVAQWAYQNHMAKPGDFVIVPVNPVQVTPTPAPKPTVVVTPVSNIQHWLALFFGP
jgi:hypothetical protein